MPIFTKESLESLRQRVDLVEVLASHIELKKSGASYKAICPFHDEKTPSFTVQKGDSHYHCFGCGAHGDAIQFLMMHLKMSFIEAVEHLAQRFQVHLEHAESSDEPKGPSKVEMKEALAFACRFYHFFLLHTHEGREALGYLYSRGIDLDFIKMFQIGLAPKSSGIFRKVMHGKFIKDLIMQEAGLLTQKEGVFREFFHDRIMIPIRDPQGAVIGFSGRKYKQDSFGGKYVNTPETPLFKKSKILFGLNYCRARIAKERRAVIVEGQLDALRLIQEGFNITVAGQGTAFGEGHVKELLKLGINQVNLAMDADEAGREAACKVGNLFQKEGVDVCIVQLPYKQDPDSFLRSKGPEAFAALIDEGVDYLEFLVEHRSRSLNTDSPAGKNELVQGIALQIREWSHPLMVHESLQKLARLAQVPENMIGMGLAHTPNIHIKKSGTISLHTVDPDRILESDFLRWLLMMGESQPGFVRLARENLTPATFKTAICRDIYQTYMAHAEQSKPCDLLSLSIAIDNPEAQVLISELTHKKVNKERAEMHYLETIQRLLDRNWMEMREEIKMKIQSGQCTDDEATVLIKKFDELKRSPPKAKVDNLEGADNS